MKKNQGKILKIKKYFIIFTLVILTFFAPKSFCAEAVLNVILPTSNFYDIPEDHWAYAEIKELHRLGIIAGYPDNKYHPDDTISREEFATIAMLSSFLLFSFAKKIEEPFESF